MANWREQVIHHTLDLNDLGVEEQGFELSR